MPSRRQYYIYIISSQQRTIYTGVTNDLARRVSQHKEKVGSGFAARYNATRLVYVEEFASIRDAIAREKEIKAMRRSRKVDLIRSVNPRWEDLARYV